MASERAGYGAGAAVTTAGGVFVAVGVSTNAKAGDLAHDGWFIFGIVLAFFGLLILAITGGRHLRDLAKARGLIKSRDYAGPVLGSSEPIADRRSSVEQALEVARGNNDYVDEALDAAFGHITRVKPGKVPFVEKTLPPHGPVPSFSSEFGRFAEIDRHYEPTDEWDDACYQWIDDVRSKLEGWNPRFAQRFDAVDIQDTLGGFFHLGSPDINENPALKDLHAKRDRLKRILGSP